MLLTIMSTTFIPAGGWHQTWPCFGISRTNVCIHGLGVEFLYFSCETMIICLAYLVGGSWRLKAKISWMLSYRETLDKKLSILSCYSDVVIEHKGRPGILSSHRGGWRPCRRPWRCSASLASSTLLSSLQLNLPPVHLETINTLIRRDQSTYHHDDTDDTLSPAIQPKRLEPSRTTGSTLSDLWLPFDLIAIMINRVLMQPIIATK